MFSGVGKSYHLNYLTFKTLFQNINERNDLIFLETGIANNGTKSTYLFDQYIRKYGGRFWSVDINRDLVDSHQGNMCPGTQLICDDSVHFLKTWVSENPGKYPDVVYLDSYDLDWYNPQPSADHGLKEYLALEPVMKKNALLLIDDTPLNPYWIDNRHKLYDDMIQFYEKKGYMPGKGQLVLGLDKHMDTLIHNYQVLFKCR
jgi:hypothetical protein